MRHRVNARVLGLIAALVLAVAAEQAGAEGLSVSNQNFRVTWSALTFEGGFGTVRCPLTLEGSFHARTLVKVEGTLMGYVTRAASGTCASGGMTVLNETIPWHVQFASFSGTLPNITAVKLAAVGAGISIREPTFGITCLGRTTAERPLTLEIAREAGGNLTTAAAGGTIATSCGINGTISGSGNVTVLGSTTRIRVEAIEPNLGDIEVVPDPILITGVGSEEVTLRYTGIGRIRTSSIAVSNGGAIFEIRDPNGCAIKTFARFGTRECRFRVFSNAAGMMGEVTVRYTRPGAEARTIIVRS